MNVKSSQSVRGLMACCVLAACAQAPDLEATASGELIGIAATAEKGNSRDSLASRAAQELFRRPDTAVVESLRTALEDDSPRIRRWAAQASGEFLAYRSGPPLEVSAREGLEAALLGLLGDEDETVRASALYGLGQGCSVRRPNVVPDEIVGTVRSLLVSTDPSSRIIAANAAMWFASDVESLAPLLVSQAKVETDSGVRFMLAAAMSRVAPRDPAVARCLGALLDDPEENVRYFAATGLGEIVTPPAAVVDRLRRSMMDPHEAIGVRRSAATSLARLTTNSEDAVPALTALLDVRKLFEDDELSTWLDAVGRVAAIVPTTESGRMARGLLESAAHEEDEEVAATATSGLARIALATRDSVLGMRAATGLRNLVPSILLAAEQELPWSADAEWAVPVLEALVTLAGWPEMQVDTDQLRLVLAALKRHRLSWTRDWADSQLDRLR